MFPSSQTVLRGRLLLTLARPDPTQAHGDPNIPAEVPG